MLCCGVFLCVFLFDMYASGDEFGHIWKSVLKTIDSRGFFHFIAVLKFLYKSEHKHVMS